MSGQVVVSPNRWYGSNYCDSPSRLGDNNKTVLIFAKQRLHLERLKEQMVDSVLQRQVQARNSITNARHYHVLKEVQFSLNYIKNGLDNNLPGDLLALDACITWRDHRGDHE